jgi:hypothetical protein
MRGYILFYDKPSDILIIIIEILNRNEIDQLIEIVIHQNEFHS